MGGLLLLGAWTKQTPTILRIAGLAVQGAGLGLFQLAYSDIATAARSRRCGQHHRLGSRATNLVVPSFGLAKGIIWKSGLDPIRAADLSSPQWSIRLRSARILPGATFMLQLSSSIETRDSWIFVSVTLLVMTMAFDAAWIIAVALKDIAGEIGGPRSIPVFASALAWLGSCAGGIMMSRIADRVDTRWTVIYGSLMIDLEVIISTLGSPGPLWIGHGLFIGLVGLGGINTPLYIDVSSMRNIPSC